MGRRKRDSRRRSKKRPRGLRVDIRVKLDGVEIWEEQDEKLVRALRRMDRVLQRKLEGGDDDDVGYSGGCVGWHPRFYPDPED